MRRLLSVLFAFGVVVSAQAADPAKQPMAVLFNAEWCLNCKLMRPLLEPLQAEYADRVDFIVLDYTTDEARSEGESLARERGFYPIVQANRATGWVALLHPDGSPAGRLTVAMDDAELRSALDSLVASDTGDTSDMSATSEASD